MYDPKLVESENEKYDIVFFTFSFMLMPDKLKALEIAKKLLKENGKILFLLTLNKKRFALAEKIKPLIKYIFTVDFGQVIYENDFYDYIKQAGLTISETKRVQVPYNILLKLFRVYYVECTYKWDKLLL